MSLFADKTGKMSFLPVKLGNSRRNDGKMSLFATKSGKMSFLDDKKENRILCWERDEIQ